MWRRLAIGCLTLAAGTALAAAPPLAESLLAAIARTPPASTPFIQVSYRRVLDGPLVVSGTLHWLGGDRLERDVTKPYRETAKLDDGELSVRRGHGKVHRVPLGRAPQVGAMLAGFRALLGGDVPALERDFTLSATGDKTARWTITLKPRTTPLKRQLQSIVIDGRGRDPGCLVLTDGNGNRSITLVGKMAGQGLASAAPIESDLVARCKYSQ